MATTEVAREFDSKAFLQFLFSVVFLGVCCFTLMLYVDKAFAFLLMFLLRFLVLPRNMRIGLGGIHFAPLQARLFFRDFAFQTENMSVHIVDGYFTFSFYGFWFRHPRWSRVHEYMVCDTLIGTRCRVSRNLTYVKGTVVAVDVEKRKISVQFDEQSVNSSGDDEEGEEMESTAGSQQVFPGANFFSVDPNHSTARDGHDGADPLSVRANGSGEAAPAGARPPPAAAAAASTMAASVSSPLQPMAAQRRPTLKEFTIPVVVPVPAAAAAGATAAGDKAGASNAHIRSEGLGDEVVKVVDANDVYVRSRAGLVQLHLNGLRVCIYNATGKYLDLARAAAAQASPATPGNNAGSAYSPRDNVTESSAHRDRRGAASPHDNAQKKQSVGQGVADDRRPSAAGINGEGEKRGGLARWLKRATRSSDQWENAHNLDGVGRNEPQMSKELRAARQLQEHNILNTSFAQRFFNFIGCVELEICAAQIDLGAVAGTHPYFLHVTFQQGEGRVFLTKDSCPVLDIYRSVTEITLREVDIRMAQMDSKLSKTQVMRNATLYERARLLFSGVAEAYEHIPFESSSSSDLIGQYGIFMDGKDKGTVHLVFYKDAANVHAGEPVRRGSLPTTGVEVLIDAPVVRYGPWLEYCRTQLWQYFLPPNYLPLQELQFEVGKPRPNAGFELLILFLRETTLEIPFKRRSVVPSPPFGIKDSKRKGKMLATIGAGAQYIQPAFFLLPEEEKQVFQGLFIAKDITVWANCVLDRETILCHAESVQFFLDRQDDRLWNGRKLWNILTKLSGVEMYFYMVYVDYFLDIINDWQFAASMYHDVPLTTEIFNTLNRSVRDFIPNVKRFEIFVESMATLYLNVNTHNVVYADDPNDLAHNIMAILKVQSGRFSMVLPSDQYQLSFENEVARPLEASAREVKAYLSLPTSHPLYDQVSSEIPWAYAEALKLHGLFSMQVPNQSIPLLRDNLDPATGRTKYHNYFNLDIEFTNLRGTLMATHIKALIQSFQNIFLDNTFTIAPDELFWLLAKLQSHATAGKNKRKEFKQFLEQSQPAGNDMEICVTVRLVDVSATAAAGQHIGAPQVNLSTGLVTFTYVKQFAVTDTAVSLAPITVRFPDRRGNYARNAESSIVVGAITVALTKHFGRMPLKPKVHESMEVHVNGVSVEVTAERLMVLVEVLQTLGRHFMMEDLMMEAEVAEALSTAELAAEKVVRAGPLRNTTDGPRGGLRRRRAGQIGGSAAFVSSTSVPNASFGNINASPDDPHDYSAINDSLTDDLVEMQEWRSAQRAAALSGDDHHRHPAHHRRSGGGGGDAGEVLVDVHGGGGDAASPHVTTSQEPTGEEWGLPGGPPILHSYESDGGRSSFAGKHGRKRRRRFFADPTSSSTQSSDAEHSAAQRHRPFASIVPYDVALGFATFMEDCNKADDDSKDYGLFFLLVSIGTVSGVVQIGDDGYASVELPAGATVAQSTVNDGNSNKRMSAAVKDIGVQLMLSHTSSITQTYLPTMRSDPEVGRYLEVLSLHTSVCLRQYVAYPFDGSLENHRAKQQRFIEDNDYEQLIGFPFRNAATHCPPTPPPPQAAPSRSSSPAAAAGGNHLSTTSPTSRGQSSSHAMPEPATMPRPTPPPQPQGSSEAAAAAGTASGTSPPALHITTPVTLNSPTGSTAPIPPTTRSWVPAGLSRSPPAEHGMESEEMVSSPALPHAFAHGSHGESASSSSSRDTMAHNQRAIRSSGSGPGGETAGSDKNSPNQTLAAYHNLSETLMPDDKKLLESSNRFETCVSLSSGASSSFVATTSDGNDDSFLNSSSTGNSSRRPFDNRAFAEDRDSASDEEEDGGADDPLAATRSGTNFGGSGSGRGIRGNRSGGGGKGKTAASAGGTQKPAAASVPPHLFYRSFDKAESDDNGVCAMDYWPPRRPSGPQKVRDRTGFHAQLPIVGFYPNTTRESRAPLFFALCKRDLLQKEEDLFAWARCVVDNRERSKHNSTSRHLHLALVDPLTVLVTPEATVLAGAAASLILRLRMQAPDERSDLQRQSLSMIAPQGNTSSSAGSPRLLRSHTKKSKARTQQKRWLWEDNIVSVSVPTVEVKLLTQLPVPVENTLDAVSAAQGVYTSTLIMRGLRGIMAQNRPPSGEEVTDASQKVSASLKLDTLAMVTQVEWEPLRREGNLFARVPNVWYNADKPTMAIVFVTQLAGKGKRDLWRGTDGGACNITMSHVAVHVTRDCADYVHQLLQLSKQVTEDVQRRLRQGRQSSQFSPVTSPLYNENSPLWGTSRSGHNNATGSSARPERAGGGVLPAQVSMSAAEVPRVRKGRTIQGKGFLERLSITLVDTQRCGERVVVRENEVSCVELLKPFCNFVVVTPNLLRNRQVHIQGVGEMDLLRVHVLPSVLHVLHPRAVRPSCSPATSATTSQQDLTPQATLHTFQGTGATYTLADGTSTFSQTTAQESSAVAAPANPEESRSPVLIYDGTFTVHTLDVSAKHTGSNYIQLIGKDLTGCAESRMESVPSRECVQTEALTETISEKLKARLRYKANRARERAKRSRYPAPPETTEQLHLKSTASFFAQQVQLHYVAECVMDPLSHETGAKTETPAANQSIQSNKVFSAAITGVALVAQSASQYDVHGDQVNLHMIVRNIVFDSPYCVRAAEMLHPQVHALLSSWKQAVKGLKTSMRGSGGVGGAAAGGGGGAGGAADGSKPSRNVSSPRSPSSSGKRAKSMLRSQAVTFQVQATSITCYVGLPQGIVQKFLLPQISCFTKTSSNGRVDMKMHLHPFTITAHNAPQENYRVVLPHVYFLYAHDPIKMLCNVTMGSIAITITPLFINHTLLTYEKLMNDVMVVAASPSAPEDTACSPVAPTEGSGREGSSQREVSSRLSSMPSTAFGEAGSHDFGSPASSNSGGGGQGGGRREWRDGRSSAPRHLSNIDSHPLSDANADTPTRSTRDRQRGGGDEKAGVPAKRRRRRQSFLFLLQGVRLSYLTSMTTLRFTIRNLNATADTTEGDSRHTLEWVVHVTDAQAALVDRDDHDQMVATYKNLASTQWQESPTVADPAQISRRAPSGSTVRGAETANIMKAAHPLGGFLWGSVGLSLTLSSGKVDENRARTALLESSSFNSYSEELQKALLDSFTNSTSKWELAVYEPLVVLRIGLDSLIKQCLRETQEDVRAMKTASYEESLTADLQLRRYKRFQRLQLEKKRIDGLIRRAQKERQRKLRNMTERVVHDVTQRRGGVYIDGGNTSDDVLSFFSTQQSHKVVATMTNFMVVVPFGDAPFRSILEELPDAFACGKTDRHIHSASCLNRKKFIPACALKLKMNTVSFICNLELVKRLVPRLLGDPRSGRSLTDSVYATGGAADQGYNTTVLFLGRFLAMDSHIFFTDGSPLDRQTGLASMLRSTSILGGQGLLSSYAAEEHKRSLNSFAITAIEAPVRIQRKNNTMTVGLVVDVSEPKGRISSLFIGILRDLMLEQPSTKLEAHLPPRPRTTKSDPSGSGGGGGSAGAVPRPSRDGSQRVLYSEEEQPPVAKEPLSLHLDITGRLEASEVAVYCYSNPERFSNSNANANAGNGSGGAGGKSGGGVGGGGGGLRPFRSPGGLRAANGAGTVTHRRVGFDTKADTPSSTPQPGRWRSTKGAGGGSGGGGTSSPTGISLNTQERFLIMSMPLPGVTVRAVVRRSRRDGADDIAVVRAEVRAGTIELSPYITALAQEVEMCADVHLQHRQEHTKKILSFVQDMENEVPQLSVPLHCPLVEVLLPMPRAYAGVLAKEEMNNVVRLRRSQTRVRPSNGGRRSSGIEDGDDANAAKDSAEGALLPPPKRKSRGLTAVHVTVSDFRLIFNTEPAASTLFTVFLDNGGTIDFVLKHFTRGDGVQRFVNKFPDVSLAVTLRRLRAECQTKLEVKSLELFLPEAEFTVSRRTGSIGVVDTVAAFFPFNVEGTEPNLTLRLQHVAQVFLVLDMWSFTFAETLRSVRHLFARGAAGDDIAKRVARTQLGRQVAKGNTALREKLATTQDTRVLLYVGLSHALCFCDIGAGSAHNFAIGEVRIAAEVATHANGCAVSLLMGRMSNTSIRSEGVLSGGMLIGDIIAKGFVIQNADDADVFARSPEQRTFRESLLVQRVHVNFKERQLKDVFECKVGDFRGNSMDGIGEEDYTTTDLDVLLRNGTLGVTPSTVPAFLSFVRNISAIITEQRRISATRLREKTLHLQPKPNAVVKGGAAEPELKTPMWGSRRKTASPQQSVHAEGFANDDSGSSNNSSSLSTQPARSYIPFMGNNLLRVPCGQLRIALDDTTVLLGAISSGEATAGCVVISFAKGRISFAECPCDDYNAAKKVLVIESHNVELYRPSTPRVVVMGFQGVNHFEFYTRQVLGSSEVGFTLTLRQTHPWTGNPRFRDFAEMIQLIKSFTDKKNADVIKHFGRLETSMFDNDTTGIPLRHESTSVGLGSGIMDLDSHSSPAESGQVTPTPESVAAVVKTDSRTLKALRSSKFSPQLRFGGDVSVNTEVILNWLGVTEKMLPHVVHMALCDKLEGALSSLAALASERVRHRSPHESKQTKPPPLKPAAESRKLSY